MLLLAGIISSMAIADDKACDKCRKLAEASNLACLKDAKTPAAKKACQESTDNKKQMCQLTCKTGLF
jgi:hypothetical protein